MAAILVCLALLVTSWTAATPVHGRSIFNMTGEPLNRTKRWCSNQTTWYNTWPGCSNYYNYYNHCYNPCLTWPTVRPTAWPTAWPTVWPTASPQTRPPVDPTPPWTIWPTQTPRPTRPPHTPVWPTWIPKPTNPPYTPIWPTWIPRPTQPPYTPIMPTVRPPYTPIMPTVRPPYTPIMPTVRPPYTPIMPTVRPPYTPIMPTVRPPYTPIMPTVRPPYTPIMPTVRPPYTPIMPTVRPPYTPIMPTVRPPYTPIMPTVRPPYTPIMPTVRPPYTPIMPTVRPPYTPIMPTRTPYPTDPTVSLARRTRCNKVCVDKNKINYCCETPTTTAATTMPPQGTCPAQTSPCRHKTNKRATQQRECMFDNQCPDDHGCCYDRCLQEYRCLRLKPTASFVNLGQFVSSQSQHKHSYHRHHHGIITRVERSPEEKKNATQSANPVTLAANDTKVPASSLHKAHAVEVTVMVDDGHRSSTEPLHHLLKPLTHPPHPDFHMLFLPLHPRNGSRTAVWEVVQCAAGAAPDHKAALRFVACVLDATPSLRSRSNSLPSLRQCVREQEEYWPTLRTCVSRGRGGSLLRGALLRHGSLLEAARKHQLDGKQTAAAVLAVNGNIVKGAAAATAAVRSLLAHHHSATSSGGTTS